MPSKGSKIRTMARRFLGRPANSQHESRIQKIREHLTWPREPPKTPWILVVGLKGAGKSTFIQKAIKLLGNESSAVKYDLPPNQWGLFTTQEGRTRQTCPKVIFRKETVAKEDDVSHVERLLDEKEGGSLPSFVVLVMKASWTNKSSGEDSRDLMLRIQQAVAQSGPPSCLLLTHADNISMRLSEFTKDKSKSLGDVDVLDRTSTSRVYVVAACPSTRHRKSDTPVEDELYITALEAIAIDAKQRVNDNISKYSESPTDGASAHSHMERQGEHDASAHSHMERQGEHDASAHSHMESLRVYDTSAHRHTTWRRTRQSPKRTRKEFRLADPETWFCLEGQRARDWTCGTCQNFMDCAADAHVICCHIDADWMEKSKVPQNDLDQFHGIVNGLLNTLEGGSICVHLHSSLHEKFRDQTSHRLREMLPWGCRSDVYVFKTSEDHIFFSVKAAEHGGRPLSTFDFKIELPRDVGLQTATQSEMYGLLRDIQREKEDYIYTPVTDPKFVQGEILPAYFVEDARRQMKAIFEKDILDYGADTGDGKSMSRKEKFAMLALKMVTRYIRAFATKKSGGCVYLGLSHEKTKRVTREKDKVVKESELVTGRFKCDGIQLDEEESAHFRDELRSTMKNMECFPQVELPDDLVEVSFPSVLLPRGGNANLRVVKISVNYFHGILWPKGDGPLAFQVIRDGLWSKIVRVGFHDWIGAIQDEILPIVKA